MTELRNVEIFAVGTWNGMKFVQDDLREIADNFVKLSNEIKAPLKFGHAEDQTLLGQDDGDFALGWVKTVRVAEDKLLADFTDVPQIVNDAISKKLFRQVSVEMDFIRHTGWALTAVALLGADLPAVTKLEDLQAFLSDKWIDSAEPVNQIQFSCKLNEEKFTMAENSDTTAADVEVVKAQFAVKEATMQARIEKMEKEAADVKEGSRVKAFTVQSDKQIESFTKKFGEGKIEPHLMSSIKEAFEKQKASFTEGSELLLPQDLSMEIMESANLNGKSAENLKEDQGKENGSAAFTQAIFKTMTDTGKSYDESADLVAMSQPQLLKSWATFGDMIHAKGVN